MLPELDYSIDENISKEMWQVLDFIFRARASDAGEAYREFLLALALERLRLRIADMEQLKKDHGENAQDEIDQLLWKKIGEIITERKRREVAPNESQARPANTITLPLDALGEADRREIMQAVTSLNGLARDQCVAAGAMALDSHVPLYHPGPK